MNACLARDQAVAIANHVPSVVGMSREIEDIIDATSFSTGFYHAVVSGVSVRQAYDLGRNRIALLGRDSATTPVLIAGPGVAEHLFIT